MIRLIATDLDGTLLNPSADLTSRTLRALRAAMAVGCGVALSSGRMLEATMPYARQIGVNAPMLLYNGAMIYDPAAAKALLAQRIPWETALRIVELAERSGYYIQLYPGEGYYCSEIVEHTRAYARSVRVEPISAHMPMAEWLRRNPAGMQKLLVIDTPEGADRAQALLSEAFSGEVCLLKSRPHFLEITPAGVDKGRALGWLAEYLGLQRDEVMAFGDGENDMPMLETAGEGYAMANACAQALACAPHTAPSNAEDGVAQVIEQALREGRFGAL